MMTEISVLATPTPELPGAADAGSTGEWALPVSDLGETLAVVGRFLGVGSSARGQHSGHPTGTYVPAGEQCRACRWFEARIFRVGEEADGDYVVYNVGQSIVPGETPRYTFRRVATAEDVLDLLTTRKSNGRSVRSVSLPAEIVLSQASQHDDDIREAYVNSPLA